MFIIDHNFDEKTQYLVDELLFEIACASWRGAYCKLLIGGSRENDSILFPALAAKARAEELGIESKIVSSQKNQNSHLKLVIVDDFVITGSHNWSKALTGDQVQDSIAILDSGLASFTSVYFNNQWIQIPNNKYDVSL